jgi:hypothetical protein
MVAQSAALGPTVRHCKFLSAAQLRNAITLLRVGQTVELRVWHKGVIRPVAASII